MASRPRISTGVDGPASSTARPRSSNIARILPKVLPTTKLSWFFSVPFCTSTDATAPRPRSSFASITVPTAGRSGVAFRLQIGHQADHLQQQVEVHPLLGRHIDEHRAAAPLFGNQSAVAKLLLHAVRLGLRLVDLVHRHDDRHVRRLRVVDRLQRLRHHAVVGRDDDHHNVGDLGAARAHPGKRLVTRRIQEDDLAPKRRRIRLG